MEISLWVLVDKGGRIYYTGDTKQIVKDFELKLDVSVGETFIINVKGES